MGVMLFNISVRKASVSQRCAVQPPEGSSKKFIDAVKYEDLKGDSEERRIRSVVE